MISLPPVVVIGVIALAVGLLVYVQQTRARNAYYGSLEKLKGDPHNAALREKTLELGRIYSQHVGRFVGNKRLGIVDEAALIDDINTYCAPEERSASPQVTVQQRLAQLDALHAKALISEGEYHRTRQRILDGD